MFAILKSKYIRCLIGIFVFIFVSFVTYSSYASVCFLPTGDCGGEDVSVDTNEDLIVWPEECIGTDCDEPCTGNNCNNSDDTETKCTTSCTPDAQTECATDSNGCSIVAKRCSGNTYINQAYCASANSGKTCTQSGSCWVVSTTSGGNDSTTCIASNGYYDTQAACTSANSGKTCTQSGSCWVVDAFGGNDGNENTQDPCQNYTVAKSDIEALQTAYGVANFDDFVNNLQKYTLESCTACPTDASKYKCEYVGCPNGKALYLNIDMTDNGVTSLLSNTNITNYTNFSLQPYDLSLTEERTRDVTSFDFYEQIENARNNSLMCTLDCTDKRATLTDYIHGLLDDNGNYLAYCVASFDTEIYDDRGINRLGSSFMQNYGYDCHAGIPNGFSHVDVCRSCLTQGTSGHYTRIHPSSITYYRNYFAFNIIDKNENNIAINMNDCNISSLSNCNISESFETKTRNNIMSLCLDENNTEAEYIDLSTRYISHPHVQNTLQMLSENKYSKYYNNPKYLKTNTKYFIYVPTSDDITEEEEINSCEELEGTLVEWDDLMNFYEKHFSGAPYDKFVDMGNEYVYDVNGETFVYYPKETSFLNFIENLSRYTLDECNVCTENGTTKFKCKYVGCPNGKKLYVSSMEKGQIDNYPEQIKTLFSKTKFSDIKSDFQYFDRQYKGYWDENITMLAGGYLIPISCEDCYKEADELGVFNRKQYMNGTSAYCGQSKIDLESGGNLGKVDAGRNVTTKYCSRWISCKGRIQGSNYEDYLDINPIHETIPYETTDEEFKNIAKERICVFENNPEEEWESLLSDSYIYNHEKRYVYDFTTDYMEADTTKIVTTSNRANSYVLQIGNNDFVDIIAICAGPQVQKHTERIMDFEGTGPNEIVKEKPIVLLPPTKWLEEMQ